MSKSPDAFRTISEVAEWLGVQAHVLRFWESKFTQVKPIKRAGGRRYYRPADMLLLGGIRKLLYDDGMSIKEVQEILRDLGIAHVSEMSHSLEATGPGESILEADGGQAQTHSPDPASTTQPLSGDLGDDAFPTAEDPAPSSAGEMSTSAQMDGQDAADQNPPPSLPEYLDGGQDDVSESQAPSAFFVDSPAETGTPIAPPPPADVQESLAAEPPEAELTPESALMAEGDNTDLEPAPEAEIGQTEPEQFMMDLAAPEPASIGSDGAEDTFPPLPDADAPLDLPLENFAPQAEDSDVQAPAPELAQTPLIEESDAAAPLQPLSENQSPAETPAESTDVAGDGSPLIEVAAQPEDHLPEDAPIEAEAEVPAALEPPESSEAHADLACQEAAAMAPEETGPLSQPGPLSFAQDGAETATPDGLLEDTAGPSEAADTLAAADIDLPDPADVEVNRPRVIAVADEDLAAQVSLRPGLLALLAQTTEIPPQVRPEIAACTAELRSWLQAQ